jgi:hypothetical protein
MPNTSLDQAWADINALGGPGRPSDPYDLGYAEALDAALEAVERQGGMSPDRRRALETV